MKRRLCALLSAAALCLTLTIPAGAAGAAFDAFTTPNQADMQLIGAWDGVEETEFYDLDKS